jgi:hypothetical protein
MHNKKFFSADQTWQYLIEQKMLNHGEVCVLAGKTTNISTFQVYDEVAPTGKANDVIPGYFAQTRLIIFSAISIVSKPFYCGCRFFLTLQKNCKIWNCAMSGW